MIRHNGYKWQILEQPIYHGIKQITAIYKGTHLVYPENSLLQFTIDDIHHGSWKYGLFQTCPMDIPDTYEVYYYGHTGELSGYISWIAIDEHSWQYTYQVMHPELHHNLVIGWDSLYMYTPQLAGKTIIIEENSPFYDVWATVNGERLHFTRNYNSGAHISIPDSVYSLASAYTNGETGYDASGTLIGTIWLPKYRIE